MHGLSECPWLQRGWQALATALHEDRLAHAWLLCGPSGLGKRQFVRAWVAAMLCDQPDGDALACGHCRSCTLLKAGSHPDSVEILLLEGASQLKIDQIRFLGERLSLTAQRGKRQVAVVDPADSLNVYSANALLKTLEEPRADTVIVLLADAPWRLPATIHSRCQKLQLSPPPRAEAMDWLAQQGLAASDAGDALDAAGGRPMEALRLFRDGGLAQRKRVHSALDELRSSRAEPQRIATELSAFGAGQVMKWIAEHLAELYRQRAKPGAALTAGAPLRKLWLLYERCLQSRERLSSMIRADLALLELLHDWQSLVRELD